MTDNNVSGYPSSSMERTIAGRKVLAKFGGHCPLIGGTHPPSVIGHNLALTDELTHELFNPPGYLSGRQTVVNLDGSSVVFELYDGDPDDEGVKVAHLTVGATSDGHIDFGGAVVFILNSLWVKCTGTTPNLTAILLLNF